VIADLDLLEMLRLSALCAASGAAQSDSRDSGVRRDHLV